MIHITLRRQSMAIIKCLMGMYYVLECIIFIFKIIYFNIFLTVYRFIKILYVFSKSSNVEYYKLY